MLGDGVTSVFDPRVTVSGMDMPNSCNMYAQITNPLQTNELCAWPTGCPVGSYVIQFDEDSVEAVYNMFNGQLNTDASDATEMKASQSESCAEAVQESIASVLLTDDFYDSLQESTDAASKLQATLSNACQAFIE